jgi:V/A-type H+/Na+-transporting ATPase subunit E
MVTTIEDKIKLFSRIIYEQVQEEEKQKFYSFDAEKALWLEEKKRSLEQKYGKSLAETRKKAEIKANELLSREKTAFRKDILAVKDALVEETVSAVKGLLAAFTGSEEYREFLFAQVKSIVYSLEKGSYIMYLNIKDKERLGDEILRSLEGINGISVRLEAAAQDVIGGIILEDEEHSFRLDSSLSTKLQEYKQHIGIAVMEALN